VLQLFRNNNPFTVIILFIFAILVKLNVLFHPLLPTPVPGYMVYNGLLEALDHVFAGKAFVYTLFSIVMLFIQALYLNYIANKYKIYHKPTYLPAFTYLLLTSLHPAFSTFSVTLLIIWSLLGGLDFILGLAQTNQPRKNIFNSAFLLSTGLIFQFSVVGYFLFFIIAFLIFRPFNIGEWAVALMGYLTPIYFFICVLFLTDRLAFLHQWVHVSMWFPMHLIHVFFLVVCLIGLVVLFGGATYAIQLQLPRTSIYVRRNWMSIMVCLAVSAGIAIGTDKPVAGAWLLTMPALCMFIANAFTLEKSKGFSNFMFLFSIILIVICQLAV
jgi:hypothetical protein